jgi:acylglycerol lipase
MVRRRIEAGAARARRRRLGLILGALAALAAACAPVVQRPLAQPADFAGPRFEPGTFVSFDGARLGLSAWTPPDDKPWAVIVGLHGMNDYGEAFYLAGPYWAVRGVATYAYDARGFGRSGQRGIWGGEKLFVEDLRAATAAARKRYPGAIIAVVGDSMGAATAIAAFASERPPDADRLVLVAPAVWGWSTMPKLYAVSLWTGAHLAPMRQVTPPRNLHITPSDNVAMLRKLGRDRLMLFDTRIDAIYGLVSLMNQAAHEAGKMPTPTAYLYGANDQIVPKAAALTAARRLPPGARTALYPRGYHMLLRDVHADLVWADILAFLRDPAAPFPSGVPPLVPPKPPRQVAKSPETREQTAAKN